MNRLVRLALATLFCTVAAASLATAPAHALDPYDVPEISCESSTLASITLNACGGLGTGALAGITIQWKKKSDWLVSGWADDGTLCKLSLSGQPSLQHPDKSRWELLPGECETITIGDINFDETGVSTNCLEPLECGTDYMFRWFAHAGRGLGRSAWGGDLECSTVACPPPGDRCTYTQGYWKNHGGPPGCDTAPVNPPDKVWPASVLSGGMTIGTVSYTAAQLCAIFHEQAGGNGLTALAHQYIAARLNLLSNGPTCTDVTGALSAADALIGGKVIEPIGSGFIKPKDSSSLNDLLTSYNEGDVCGYHCGDPGAQSSDEAASSKKAAWGQIKVRYR